jgi:hypothetical protein
MPTRALRRTASLLLVTALVVTATACQTVKAGTRCRANAGTARDATHIMVCKNGKWTRLMSIGQAAQAVMALQPSFIEGYSSDASVAGSSTPGTVRAHVLRGGSMAPAVGAEVTFTMPTSGPGGTIIGSSTVKTDANGIAVLQYAPNTIAGAFEVTAKVGAVAPIQIRKINAPAAAENVVAVSGGGQTTSVSQEFPETFVLRITDRYGNVVGDDALLFDFDPTLVDVSQYLGFETGGTIRFRAVGLDHGSDSIYVGVQRPDGTYSVAEFPFTVT